MGTRKCQGIFFKSFSLLLALGILCNSCVPEPAIAEWLQCARQDQVWMCKLYNELYPVAVGKLCQQRTWIQRGTIYKTMCLEYFLFYIFKTQRRWWYLSILRILLVILCFWILLSTISGISNPQSLPVFVHEVSLGHSCSHSFTYYLWLPLSFLGRMESLKQRLNSPQSLTNLSVSTLQKKSLLYGFIKNFVINLTVKGAQGRRGI